MQQEAEIWRYLTARGYAERDTGPGVVTVEQPVAGVFRVQFTDAEHATIEGSIEEVLVQVGKLPARLPD
jgi:hypothetical protein